MSVCMMPAGLEEQRAELLRWIASAEWEYQPLTPWQAAIAACLEGWRCEEGPAGVGPKCGDAWCAYQVCWVSQHEMDWFDILI